MQAEIQDYLDGMSWADLQSKYKCNSKKIYKLLEENNIPRRKLLSRYEWPKEKQELLRNMYTRNCTYNEIYEALNCKGGTLTYWVKKSGLPMRGSGRKVHLINPFLEETTERDYWLGYIFADGHVDRYRLNITTKEEETAKAFCRFCRNQARVNERKYIAYNEERIIYTVYLSSVELAEWFRSTFHIDSKKHHTPDPDIDINRDIVRGYFDGDGSVHKGGGITITSCS